MQQNLPQKDLLQQRLLREHRNQMVTHALQEDIGSGDINAQLVDIQQHYAAQIISRERAVICGRDWVDEVFSQLDVDIEIDWQVSDGDWVEVDQCLAILKGNARQLLSGERVALNFLQTLSATATTSRHYADIVRDSHLTILDTRKTIPGLRLAQKYAVQCGGCSNHRMGLYDAYLIKENHIVACGGISQVVQQVRRAHADKVLEIEVENFEQMRLALSEAVNIIMLDNFSMVQVKEAVRLRDQYAPTTELEVSGNVDETYLRELADSGVDYVSIGALTKHCQAIDLSMLFTSSC